MTHPYFSGSTLDDLMRLVFEAIQLHGDSIRPSKGPAVELAGVLLELTDPRARLSRTEARGRPFSCLGELCWYLAGANDLEFISYYIPRYRASADDGIIFGGYGPRLFNWKGIDQLANVIDLLRKRPDSRRAVIQLFDALDLVGRHSDVPCTCTLQFMLRRNMLHVFTNMRSNDAFLGLPHDIFSFTMIQEIVARALSVELGTYKHAVGSLHLYDLNRDKVQQFLDEGWQSTEMHMPPMPVGDPWPSLRLLLAAESMIRNGSHFDQINLEDLDPYWADLIRLLQVFGYRRAKKVNEILALAKGMASPVYRWFISQQITRAEGSLDEPTHRPKNHA